jgi:large subunit ribosomal protein L29
MKISEIRGLNSEELVGKLNDLRQEKLNLSIQQQTGQLERPTRLTEIRKDVARIETILSERKAEAKK